MAITVVVNYPQTEEGMLIFQQRQAEAAMKLLRKKLTRKELSEVMQKLRLINAK